MKFGIVTHYDVHNHGAVLQLNALVKVLAAKGITANALQFQKNYDFMESGARDKYEISLRSIPVYLRYLADNGPRKMLFNIKKKRILETFKRGNKLVGGYYTRVGELDAVIIGSDEVFALHTGPTPLFFGHACPGRNVFSYAASFGPTKYDDIERLHCLPFVESGLSAMIGISVRDRNSYGIAELITGKQPRLVCDPVILYGYSEEIKSLPPVDLPPYILVYAYDRNMNEAKETSEIIEFAKANNLKTLSAGFYHKWCDINVNPDPVQLLGYFAGAEYVVTDTFHGSVMSIITGRNMAVRIRGNGNKLHNLLEEYGLTGRIISENAALGDILGEDTDHESVESRIAEYRAGSMAWLDGMINETGQ